METFRALRLHRDGDRVEPRLERIRLDDLSPGNVVIRASHSCVNFKDALAVTGQGRVVRRYPLVPGIDVAGRVLRSDDPRYREGDRVLVTGYGLGEEYDGGYSELVRVHADWIVPIPEGLTEREAMQIGTAGFTAALALERLEHAGTHPAGGPVLVTGATGGVGSLAIDIFSKAGYSVTALTGKPDRVDYLRTLGADEVLLASDVEMGKRPLQSARWGAAVDSLGGDLLAWILSATKPWGNVASIGLAAGTQVTTTVMPFIIRGVSLIGINSPLCPHDIRERVWQRLAQELKPRHLDRIACHEIGLDGIVEACRRLLAREATGRFVIRM
jgi:acrylyl-CoA reductase (NADPH)